MSRVIFEDRTADTPEQVLSRQLMTPAGQVATVVAGMCQGDVALTMRLLAAALGLAAAQSGASVDDLAAAMKMDHDTARAMQREQEALTGKTADA